ncbi:MAG: methyltransferase domain-containing protein [Chloroherpetonaceae bacterium]|nr:methyltransferase domain-containing protein [Chloroherpetonaceae bacterium]
MNDQIKALKEELNKNYDISESTLVIASEKFHLVSVADSYKLLDRITPEEFVKDEEMPYWAEIWPSSIHLSEFILKNLHLKNKRLIEIGAGIGLCGVAAAKMGASVLCTDYSNEALKFITLNGLLNQFTNRDTFDTTQLDWRWVQIEEKFDFLIAADVLYERRNVLPIVTALEKLLKPEGTAFIADPRRSMANGFLELLHENGFHFETLSGEFKTPTGNLTIDIFGIRKTND